MESAAKLLPDDGREERATPGISIDDQDEIEQRAAEARSGAPGVAWNELKRGRLT